MVANKSAVQKELEILGRVIEHYVSGKIDEIALYDVFIEAQCRGILNTKALIKLYEKATTAC